MQRLLVVAGALGLALGAGCGGESRGDGGEPAGSAHRPRDGSAGLADPPDAPAGAAADAKAGDVAEDYCGGGDGGLAVSTLAPGGEHAGFLPGAAGPYRGSCGGGSGGELVFAVEVTRALESLVVEAVESNTSAEVVLYVRASCADAATELACASGTAAVARVPAPQPGRYFVFVDGVEARSAPFRVRVRGTVPRGGACDPGDATFACADGLACVARGGAAPACLPAACGDGADNDGDGRTDFPVEPGCASVLDDDEADPPTPPACANGADDDGDGHTDHPADPGCDSAADDSEIDSCVPGLPVEDVSATGLASGDTTGLADTFRPGCDSTADGGERAFRFELPGNAARLDVRFTERFSGAVLAVRRDDCGMEAAEVACSSFREELAVEPAPAGRYFVVVDTAYGAGGRFALEIRAELEPGAACQPGSATARCGEGYVCAGTCRRAACGDGMDNDGDRRTDFPAEPGCAGLSDDDETDPATPPVCANGADDDMDGQADWPEDLGCPSASGDSEAAPCGAGVEVTDITASGGAMGTTEGAPDGQVPMCASGATRGERVYAYRLPAGAARLRARLATDFSGSVLHVRRGDCRMPAAELACSYSEQLEVAPAQAGTYFVFVDSDFGTGAFELVVEAELAAGAGCDPMNARARCEAGLTCRGDGGAAPTCQRPRCSNGADDDGDGRADFPAEPGCATPSDDDEADPATPAACANGLDDDMDGQVDYPADTGCTGAGADREDAVCGPGVVVEDITASGMASGSNTDATSQFSPTTCGNGTPNTAGERVYMYRLAAPGNVRFSTDNAGTSFDTVIYVRRDDCASTEIACNDDGAGVAVSLSSTVTLRDQAPGVFFVFVDGYAARSGSFVLTATTVP